MTRKTIIKTRITASSSWIILICCLLFPLTSFQSNTQLKRKEVVCFVYHRVGDSRYPTTNTSIKDFESHLSYLTKNKFRLVTFSDAIKHLRSDEAPQKIAVITIDDGYKSFFKNGFPLLKKYNVPATLFINTESVGGGDMMNWNEIETVFKNNVEIGNHTHSHSFFLNSNASVRYTKFRDEIKLSQSIIQEKLGVAPIVFTYPYGEFDPEMKKIVRELGFIGASAQNSGVASDASDPFMYPRFPMSESYSSLNQFKEKAAMRALVVTKSEPETFVLADNKQPTLTLTIESTDLRTNQFQCFIQGNTCTFKVISESENQTIVSLRANKPMTNRRRTLYTLTVPDKEGKWHWYSHVWINPKVKDE